MLSSPDSSIQLLKTTSDTQKCHPVLVCSDMKSVFTLALCIFFTSGYMESLGCNLLLSCIYFSINFWKKLYLWIFAAGNSDSLDSWKGKCVGIVCSVGNKPGIRGQCVLRATGSTGAQLHPAVCEQPGVLSQECQDNAER